MKHLTIMKLTTVFFVILFLSCFFEATNPLDSAYQGSYNFESTDTLPSQLEVLKEYKIHFKNIGTDKYWKFYCSFDPSVNDSVVRRVSSDAYDDSGFVSFVFKKVYTGKIKLIAEQPNRTLAEMPLRTMGSDITVINPYTIDYPRLAGIGDSVFLKILYKGKTIQTAGLDSVFVDDRKNLLSDSINLQSPTSKTTISYDVRIKRNNELNYDTFNFPAFTISYPGYSPRICKFSIDTSVYSLKLGGPARFSVRLNNDTNNYKYSGNHIYKITSGTSILAIDTFNYVDSNSIQVVTVDTLKDILYPKLTLTVYNSDTLTDTMSLPGIKVLPSLLDSSFKFRDSNTTVDQDSLYKVDVVINESFAKDSFYWSYRNVKDSLTVTPYIIIPPSRGTSDTISVYVKRVYVFGDKKFEYKSDTITKVINPITFSYKIQMKSALPKQIVAKNPETFQVSVTSGTVPVPDSSLTYSWTFPSVDTNFVKIVPKNPKGSGFTVTVLDSTKLKKFYFFVKAKLNNGTDSTALLKSTDITEITVRNYRPSLTLIKPVIPVTNLAQDIAFDVSDSNGVVNTVYYKFSDTAVSDDKSVKSVAPQSKKFTLFFKHNGIASVKAWAVDTSGFVSDTQQLSFSVSVITPQFPIKPDTVKATIGSTKMLRARLSAKLDSITYLWDRNGNGIYSEKSIDTTTFDCDSISFTPQDSIPDTIFVQCVNKVNERAPNPYTLIVLARKNQPVIDTLRVVDTATAKYKNDSIRINAWISDPDSNLKSVKITWSVNGSADSILYIDSLIKSPFKTKTIDTTKKNNTSGLYKFTVTATDSRGNSSTSSITHKLLIGDPVITSVIPSKSTCFVRKNVKVTTIATDPNGGRIDSIQYIKSNDTSVITTRPWPDSILTLNDTGLQYIRVRVIDNEGNRSAIKSTDSQIRVLPHTPRIDSITPPVKTAYDKQDINFIIHAYDTCSTWEQSSLTYSVSYDDTFHFVKLPSKTISRSFTTLGINRFFVKVTDADSLSTIKADSITILDGKPVFVSGIDQTLRYWTNDECTLKFRCSDPYGTVDKLEIDWGDGSIKSSLDTRISENGIFTFEKNKIFKNVNKKDSTYRITLTFTDNDAKTVTAVDSITIRQGKPTLRPSFGNDSTTIFGKYDPSNALLPCLLSVHAADVNPNGSILKYYWFLSRDSSSLESANHDSTESTYELKNIPTNVANTIYTYVTVLVMDDDSNLVKKKFNIYVDAPPQVPVLLDPVNGTKSFTINTPVVFDWTGHDVHDSLNTKFSVFVRIPGSSDYTLIQNPVITVEMVGTVPHFKYNFTNTSISGGYSWKIVATDQLGSVTSSDPNVNSSFVIQQ
jgi:hypothetical protein